MKCDLGDYEVDVEVIRKQNKNVYFRINDDYSLCVTCPKYMTDFDIKRLINSEHLLIDGTFIYPNGYMQTIIIMY